MRATKISTEPEVLITREFEAPRELVFAAWSEAQSLQRWFAPQGCELTHCAIDFRPGGTLHTCIRTPDGKACWAGGEYRAIEPPRRIEFTMRVVDAQGRDVEPTAAGMDPDWPAETTVTIELEALGPRHTRLTLRQTVSEALARRTGAYPSWLSMFERLATQLAAQAEAR